MEINIPIITYEIAHKEFKDEAEIKDYLEKLLEVWKNNTSDISAIELFQITAALEALKDSLMELAKAKAEI